MVSKWSDSIPVDLLIDIFSRVPAKSIARFRCVSKLWAYVLLRPDFTELFLSKSRTRPRLLFSLSVNGTLFFYSSPRPQNLDHDEERCVVASCYHKYLPENLESSDCTLVRGLALLEGDCYEKRVICNPATGEFLTLPKVKGKVLRFYFGYDPINKQFKVLCTTSFSYPTIKSYLVLRLETGKPSWKRIESKFDFSRYHRFMGGICINGVLYFGANLDGSCPVIVSFDVRSEKFGFIKAVQVEEELDMMDPYHSIRSLTLIKFKGKLGITDMDQVLWVLEDAGSHKWSKIVYALSDSVRDKVRWMRLCRMSDNGDELVWSPNSDSNPFYLLFYNMESKSLTRVNIEGFQEFKERRRHIVLHSLDYAENINIKNENWYLISREEKSVSKYNLPVSTSNKFDILSLAN